jgi:peptidoglycan/LPS O-acetylase OafA/YrhL
MPVGCVKFARMTVARDNLDALTGLRFVAAFTIAVGHTEATWLAITGIGMPLFFTLSGFIIHYVYADVFAARRPGASREFAAARFSRIYPLYFVLLVFSLTHGPMRPALLNSEGLPVLASYFLACWTWWPFTLNGELLLEWYFHISWSVSTEIFFYVVYALVLYRIARLTSLCRCLIALVGFCIGAYALFYVLFLTRDFWEPAILQQFPQFTSRTTNFNGSFYRWILYVSPYSRIFEFVGGVLTCQLFRLARSRPDLRARIPSGLLALVAIAAIAVLFAAFQYLGEHNPWLSPGNHSFGAYLVTLHMNFLFAAPCYLLIFSLALGGSAVAAVLSSRVCCLLGDVSYSTYLSHPLAERILLHAGVVVTAWWAHLLVVLVIISAMSWALYSVVEVPAKRGLRQLLTPRRLAVAAPGGG